MSLPWAEQERKSLPFKQGEFSLWMESGQSRYDSLRAIESSYWSCLGLFNLKTKGEIWCEKETGSVLSGVITGHVYVSLVS